MRKLILFAALLLAFPMSVFAVKADGFDVSTKTEENTSVTGYIHVMKTQTGWGKTPTYMKTVYLLKNKSDFNEKFPALKAIVQVLGLDGNTEKVLKICPVKSKCMITGDIEVDSENNMTFVNIKSVVKQ